MPTASPPTARPRRTLRGTGIRIVALLGVLLVVAWLAWTNIEWGRILPQRREPVLPASSERREPAQPAVLAARPPSEAVLKAQESVVLIEADGLGGLVGVGAGVVIDPSGLVATSYHLSSDLTAGVVRFQDGRVFAISGYAAVDPENDLAVLQLEKASGLAAAKLKADENLRPLSSVVAIGHPRGVEFALQEGKISRRIRTSQLADLSRRFVRALGGSQDHSWIQHTAILSEGNSGGPLVNERGEVLGINTWVDRQAGFGYALDVTPLIALQKKPLPEVAPLEAYATQEARRKSLLLSSSAEQLKMFFDQAQAMHWRPQNARDYLILQKVAWMVTIASEPSIAASGDELNERLIDLARQADRVAAQLRSEKWSDVGQITLLNEFAAASVTSPATGVAFFGTVERQVEGGGRRALLVTLAGFDQKVLIPLGSKLAIPPAGAQCLILGINDRGETVSYGENPLEPTIAAVVTAAMILELE